MFERTTLGSLDVIFFVSSLAVTLFIGLYFANKNKTFADYARGGGNQNIWAVSASMAAGYCSALTLIGNPSELYMHGTSFTLKMGTTIVAWPMSSLVFLPVFRRLEGVSIFQVSVSPLVCLRKRVRHTSQPDTTLTSSPFRSTLKTDSVPGSDVSSRYCSSSK